MVETSLIRSTASSSRLLLGRLFRAELVWLFFTVLAFTMLTTGVQSFSLKMATSSRPRPIETPSFQIPDMANVQEQACMDAASRMKQVQVPMMTTNDDNATVGISYIHWPATSRGRSTTPPIVLIHGFDSSCLEYRRLGPLLSSTSNSDVYAVDLLGWGFTQLDGPVSDFSARSKVQALRSFIDTTVTTKKAGSSSPFYIAGSSLGGAAAMEIAATVPHCAGLILIDAQGFVDGLGPMSNLPTPLAKLGVQVLQSVALRRSANQMSYYDKETYATEDAVTIGRLHCCGAYTEDWKMAMVNFMQSGGFRPSTFLSQIRIPTLVLWGRQDNILDGKEFAPKFLQEIPTASLRWIEECGHVPHLEQPNETAQAIAEFVQSTNNSRGQSGTKQGATDDKFSLPTTKNPIVLAASAIGITTAGVVMADLLPLH